MKDFMFMTTTSNCCRLWWLAMLFCLMLPSFADARQTTEPTSNDKDRKSTTTALIVVGAMLGECALVMFVLFLADFCSSSDDEEDIQSKNDVPKEDDARTEEYEVSFSNSEAIYEVDEEFEDDKESLPV